MWTMNMFELDKKKVMKQIVGVWDHQGWQQVSTCCMRLKTTFTYDFMSSSLTEVVWILVNF